MKTIITPENAKWYITKMIVYCWIRLDTAENDEMQLFELTWKHSINLWILTAKTALWLIINICTYLDQPSCQIQTQIQTQCSMCIVKNNIFWTKSMIFWGHRASGRRFFNFGGMGLRSAQSIVWTMPSYDVCCSCN